MRVVVMAREFSDSLLLLIIFCNETFSRYVFWDISICDLVPYIPGSLFYMMIILTPVPIF